MIKIKRDSGYADRLRPYLIILDGNVIGEVKNGQEVALNVPAGSHQMYLKIDWCRSNVVEFESNGNSTAFECGSSLRGLKILLSLLYTTLLRNDYLWLKQKQ